LRPPRASGILRQERLWSKRPEANSRISLAAPPTIPRYPARISPLSHQIGLCTAVSWSLYPNPRARSLSSVTAETSSRTTDLSRILLDQLIAVDAADSEASRISGFMTLAPLGHYRQLARVYHTSRARNKTAFCPFRHSVASRIFRFLLDPPGKDLSGVPACPRGLEAVPDARSQRSGRMWRWSTMNRVGGPLPPIAFEQITVEEKGSECG
jgi:hypothetical protein